MSDIKMRSQLPHDWDRGVAALLDLAEELRETGFHHVPTHAEAMRLALGKAHTCTSGNNVGDALVALGAFWDIFRGDLAAHPEYANREAVKMAANLIPLLKLKTFMGKNGWRITGRSAPLETFVKNDRSFYLPRSHEYEPEKCRSYMDSAVGVLANDLHISESEVRERVSNIKLWEK